MALLDSTTDRRTEKGGEVGMKRNRDRILKMIGKGVEEARYNRLRQQAPIRRNEQVVQTLRGVQIVQPEFLEEAKKQIAYDFGTALYRSNKIKWTITDDHDPILRGCVRIQGDLQVVEPKGR